jgi:hypothetical protein
MEGIKYGYARVSTDDQTPALQLAALKKAGCKIQKFSAIDPTQPDGISTSIGGVTFTTPAGDSVSVKFTAE